MPADESSVESLPMVAADEMGVPLSEWTRVRTREARRPDGTRVWIAADSVIAGLEPDPDPVSRAATPQHQRQTDTPSHAASHAAESHEQNITGDEATTGSSGKRDESTPVREPDAEPFVTPQRFTHGGDVLVPSGERARARANIAALEVVADCAAGNRYATADEQNTLARWSGWGGCPNVFDPGREEWAAERERLQQLITAEEYQSARASTLNAHYTDPAIAQAMWDALVDAGFSGGRVLEPGCGSGNFIGLAPDTASMVGVENDPVSARVAHLLYPDAQVRNEGFERTRVPEGSFTAAIGNVPFGRFTVPDPVHNSRNHSIHNHFIIKTLHLTAPGGYAALITSSWTLDAADEKARREMHELGELVSAIRLPSRAFQRVAATDVVTDVLVFRRRDNAETVPHPETVDWIHAGPMRVRDRHGEWQVITVNQHYHTRPSSVLGQIHAGRGQFHDAQMVVINEDLGSAAEQLRQRLHADVTAAVDAGHSLSARPRPSRGSDFQAGIATARDLTEAQRPIGRVEYDAEADEFVREGLDGPETLSVFKTRVVETKHLLRLRDLAEATIAAQRDGTADKDMRDGLREELGRVYDAYVAAYGPINRAQITGGTERSAAEAEAKYVEAEKKWRAKNGVGGVAYRGELPAEVAEELTEKAWQTSPRVRRQRHLEQLRGDPSMAAVLALEHFDTETKKPTKTAIFSRDVVVAPVPVRSAESAEEAVSISVGESGGVDLDRIAQLLGCAPTEARDRIRGLVYADPQSDGQLVPASTALSGNVIAKHEQARTALSEDPGNGDLREYVDALAKVIPPRKEPSQIGAVSPGVTWVAAEDYAQFVKDVFGARTATVEKSSQGWVVDVPAGERNTPLMRTEYGADNQDYEKSLDAIDLWTELLNQRPIAVKNSPRERDDGAPEIDSQATVLAHVQARKITSEFQGWLWSDDDRRERLTTEWNRRFNAWVAPRHDGRYLSLPGLSPAFTPHPYQRNAVARIAAEPTVLLDHVVGAGKTGTMFMAAMELKRRGVVSQPWIVVPTHLIEQFGREVKQWYPAANALVGGKGMSPEERRTFVAQTATSDWDMVIVPASVFEKIKVAPDRREAYVRRELADLEEELQQRKDSGASHQTVKAIERAKKSQEKRLSKLLESKSRDEGVTFENSGCDYIFLDEAHEYKNKARQCAIESLSHEGSQKAEDLSMKLDLLRERAQERAHDTGLALTAGMERVATFATGTPIANSLAESWVMQQYLRPDVLDAAGVRSVTDWAAAFTQKRSETVTNVAGTRLRVETVTSSFSSPREMFAMSAQYADVVTRDQVPAKLPVYGERTIITTRPSQEVLDFITDLEHRLDHLDPREPQYDNTLKVLSDGQNVALDPRLANLTATRETTRAYAVAQKAADIYHANRDNEYLTATGERSATPGALQMVFCDRGTPKEAGSWTVYHALRDELIAAGVPAESIRFIHEARSPQQKLALQEDARTGKIAVLIGSTKTMGTGMNVQDRMIALHHMDVPWRPADLEQREGRIIRQGNQNPRIEICGYVTEGTTDTVMWQKVERKARFIAEAKTGQLDPTVTEVQDVDSSQSLVDAAAATKAAATGDERFLRMVELQSEVDDLQALANAHRDSRMHAAMVVQRADRMIPQLERARDVLEQLVVDHGEWDEKGRRFTVAGQSYRERPERSLALLTRAREAFMSVRNKGIGEKVTIAEFPHGVTLQLSRYAMSGDHAWFHLHIPEVDAESTGRLEFSVEVTRLMAGGPSGEQVSAVASGLATRVENLYARLPEKVAAVDEAIENYRATIRVHSPRIDVPFDKAKELQDRQVDLQTLRMELQAAQNTPEAIAGREAAAERMRRAGREPGWSLELNPTKATLEDAGLTAEQYVAATIRRHAAAAHDYTLQQSLRGAEMRVEGPAPEPERETADTGADEQQGRPHVRDLLNDMRPPGRRSRSSTPPAAPTSDQLQQRASGLEQRPAAPDHDLSP